jgi:hypothetical protein
LLILPLFHKALCIVLIKNQRVASLTNYVYKNMNTYNMKQIVSIDFYNVLVNILDNFELILLKILDTFEFVLVNIVSIDFYK